MRFPLIGIPLIILTATAITFSYKNSVALNTTLLEAPLIKFLALQPNSSTLKKDSIIYTDIVEEKQLNGNRMKILRRFLHAKQFDGQQMNNVIVIDRSQNSISRIIYAKSSKIGKGSKSWIFSNGIVYEINPKSSKRNRRNFKKIEVDLGKTLEDITSLDQKPKNSESPKDNFTYSDVIEKIQPDGSKVKKLVRFFYYRQLNNQKVDDIVVVDQSSTADTQVIEAKSGNFNTGKKSLNLSNGIIYRINTNFQNDVITTFNDLILQF